MSEDHEALSADEAVDLARDLLASEAWIRFFRPYLEEKSSIHNDSCRARSLSPAQRAEHIEAAHVIPEIIRYPEAVVASAKAARKT